MSEFMTVVIRLPPDSNNRKTIQKKLFVGNSFHGGVVTGISADDEITVIEIMEEICDPGDFDRARRIAKQMHKVIGGD